MTYYAISKHTDSEARKLDFHPSQAESRGLVPPAFADKAEARAWMRDDATDHIFYSTVEPVNPGRRCTIENPPAYIHGIVADYDAPFDEGKLLAKIASVCGKDLPAPTWMSTTSSGYLRLVWEFESCIRIPEGSAKDFLKALGTRLRVEQLSPGFDKSSYDAHRYYEVGVSWKQVGTDLVSKDLVTGVAFKAFKPVADADVSVPFEDVKAEVLARYGSRISGEFEDGARVPLFWIDDGIDRPGAIVHEEGVYAFSDRATYAWNSWGEILGHDWVKKYVDRKIATSVDDIWFDGRNYWISTPGRVYQELKENVVLRLKQMGFTHKVPKGKQLSEIEQVLYFINESKRVDGVGPFVFRKEEVVRTEDGRDVLNTSRVAPIQPADDGDPARWPWLYKYFDGLFGGTKVTDASTQKDLAWLQRFYLAAYEKRRLSGHCLIISGPTGKGKTLLSKQVIHQLVGGSADARTYLTGQEKFNANLITKPLWTVDDTSSAHDWKHNRLMTDLIKRSVANPFVEAREMYVSPTEVEWNGRLIITLNEDANSLSIVPQQDSSNRDKVIGLRVSPSAHEDFLPNEEMEALIRSELPFFAKWLVDTFKLPKDLQGTPRFGVISWFHPYLRDAARDNSPTQAVMEIIDLFAKLHRDNSPTPIWQGTVAELVGDMNRYPEIRQRGGSFEYQRLARDLHQAAENCTDNKSIRPVVGMPTGGGTVWLVNLGQEFDLRPQA